MEKSSLSLSIQGRIAEIYGTIVRTATEEVRGWPNWWNELTLARKVTPLLAILAYWLALRALHGFRADHLTMGILLFVFYYGGKFVGRILEFLFPVLLTAILYDSMRFYSDYIRGPVHVREPYDFDRRFFGIKTAAGILTPNEWFQLHTHPYLDLLTGFGYLTFISVFALVSAYFYFWLSSNGTRKHSAFYIRDRRSVFGWSFFWVNIFGYSTYYWYAAAPPWYVALYGLGPAQMDARPNPAGCLRFDQILGTHFFSEFYGRSADVFGAIPSLHVAYPLISVYFAFRFGAMRTFSIFFYLLICFSAVYLNHHYVLDIIWGSFYALATALIMDLYVERKARARQVRLDLPRRR